MSTRPIVISMYRRMLRSSARFHDYNFRSYAVRRVRQGFREHINADQDRIPALLEQAQKDALLLDRQSAINGMYAGEQSVVPQFVQGAKEA